MTHEPVFQNQRTGQPLDPGTRRTMEDHFATKFDHVRIHDDPEADVAARRSNARALTFGSDVYLAAGEHRPDTIQGLALLAHELAHTIQQGRSRRPDRGAIAPGEPRDEAAADHAALTGQTAGLRPTGLRLQRCSRDKPGPPAPTASRPTPQPAAPPAVTPAVPPAPEQVFEQPDATTSAGARAAMTAYRGLNAASRTSAFQASYSTGRVKAVLSALGPQESASSFGAETRELLGWIRDAEGNEPWVAGFLGNVEREVAVSEAGISEDEMAQKQATREARRAPARGWGGTTTPRFSGLIASEKARWTRRANSAIPIMARYAQRHHPELNVTNATFEWEPTKIDEISLGAVATEGSQPGSTVYIGFEFVVLVELNPAYAMSTVAHELLGHATYDEGGSNFQAALYGKSQTIDPSLPSGEETYEYWPSEIYSLLREYPYWTKVADSDQSKRLALPGGAKRPQRINYDPRDAIRGLLRQMKDRWDPALHVPLARGYVQRLRVDPHIDPAALKEFEACVRAVFASSADRILQ